MTVYQELQLGSAGSKNLIKNTLDKKEKWRHIRIYNFKVYLVAAFCFLFVTGFSIIFGTENSVAGVVVLLSLLVLRQADFGITTSHGVLVVCMLFGILAAGPRVSNMAGPGLAFFINVVCILAILVLSCHNILMSNQATFVLSYLLLQGYDVTGRTYVLRLVCLGIGMVLCAAVFYKNHKNSTYRRDFTDLLREFDLRSFRTQWYLRLTLGISSAMLIVTLLQIPKPMWVGIACMSVLLPFTKDMQYRVKRRGPFNILGCGIFLFLYLVLPESMRPFLGVIGGIGVGYSAGYAWQTAFNTFGALVIAVDAFGLTTAIGLRMAANIFASLYVLIFDGLLQQLAAWLSSGHAEEKLSETA